MPSIVTTRPFTMNTFVFAWPGYTHYRTVGRQASGVEVADFARSDLMRQPMLSGSMPMNGPRGLDIGFTDVNEAGRGKHRRLR